MIDKYAQQFFSRCRPPTVYQHAYLPHSQPFEAIKHYQTFFVNMLLLDTRAILLFYLATSWPVTSGAPQPEAATLEDGEVQLQMRSEPDATPQAATLEDGEGQLQKRSKEVVHTMTVHFEEDGFKFSWRCFGCGFFFQCDPLGTCGTAATDERRTGTLKYTTDPNTLPRSGIPEYFSNSNIVGGMTRGLRGRGAELRIQAAETIPAPVQWIAYDATVRGTRLPSRGQHFRSRNGETSSVAWSEDEITDAIRSTRSAQLEFDIRYQMDEL